MDKTQNAVAIFDKHAQMYQDKFMNVDLYADTLDVFCQHIPMQNAEVLELACGPGNITHYLLQKRPDLKMFGTDLAPNMLELAKINNPSAEFQLLDCRDIDKLDKKYDALMVGFCLPYLSKDETRKLIKDAHALLNIGGVLYLSTMEADYGTSGIRYSSTGDAMYMYYYLADDLLEILKENDFQIIDLQRKTTPAPDGNTVTDLIIIAKK